MARPLAEVEREALSLSAEDRVRLAETLYSSVQETAEPGVSSSWDREIGARVAAFERGECATTDAEVVFEEATRLIG